MIEFKPNPKQWEGWEWLSTHESPNHPTVLLALGGWRAGKSTLMANKAVEYTLGYPGNTGLVLRKTYTELKDTTYPFLGGLLRQAGGKLYKDEMKYVHPNGSEVLFRSAVHDGKEDPAKFGSMELGWFWMEEANEMNHLTFNTLKGRLSHKGVPLVGMLSSNPPDKQHWLHRVFETENLPRHSVIKISTRENARNLPEGYVTSLLEQYGSSWTRRYVDGEWGILATGDSVHPEYDEKLHVSAHPYVPALDRPILRGWDAHPNGLYIGVVWAQLGYGGKIHFIKAALFQRTGVQRAIDDVVHWTRTSFPGVGCADFGDPAMFIQSQIEMVSIADVMLNKGINLQPGASAFQDRRETVADWLQKLVNKEPALQINPDPDTLWLRDGLAAGYCWPSLGEGYVSKKVPEKNEYSHVCEAAQYLLTGLEDWRWALEASQVKRGGELFPTRDYGWMGA